MTIFEKIASREITADIVYEDDVVFAIRDIHPQAPVHVLIIPKKPIADASKIGEFDSFIIGRMLLAANNVAISEGIDQSGYRLIMNVGDDAGQTVDHLHMHVLGGKSLGPLVSQ